MTGYMIQCENTACNKTALMPSTSTDEKPQGWITVKGDGNTIKDKDYCCVNCLNAVQTAPQTNQNTTQTTGAVS